MPLARAVRTCSSWSCSIIDERDMRVYCAAKIVESTAHGMTRPENQATGSSVRLVYLGCSKRCSWNTRIASASGPRK
ncbi:hypothetical protein GCM10020295_28170 [Streptomyces cinereospinus]